MSGCWGMRAEVGPPPARDRASTTGQSRDHRPWYDKQRPDLFAAALRAVKRVIDPEGLLNPGVLIDPLEQGST